MPATMVPAATYVQTSNPAPCIGSSIAWQRAGQGSGRLRWHLAPGILQIYSQLTASPAFAQTW
jgi:hypothetical protein